MFCESRKADHICTKSPGCVSTCNDSILGPDQYYALYDLRQITYIYDTAVIYGQSWRCVPMPLIRASSLSPVIAINRRYDLAP